MGARQKKNHHSFLIQGTILAAAGIITRIIGIIYRIPMTNILGDSGAGLYQYAFSIYNISLILTSYSLPIAVSKLVAARTAKGEYHNAYKILKAALLFAVGVGTAIAIVIFFGADFISRTMLKSHFSMYALKVLAPCLLVVAVLGVVRGYFQGLGTMVPTAISQVLEQIVNGVVSVVGASYLFKMGTEVAQKTNGNKLLGPAYGAAGGTLGTLLGAAAALAFMIFIFYAFQRVMRRQLKRDRSQYHEGYKEIFLVLLLTIAPVILSSTIYNVSESLDSFMFNNIMAAQGFAEKEYLAMWGMFSKYNQLVNIPLAMANALGASVMPSLTAAVAERSRRATISKINMVIRFVMLIAIPSCVGLIVLARPIVTLLYTSGDLKTTAYMLQLGGITVIFYCLSTVTNAILQGLNHMTVPVKNAAISLVIHVAAVFIMLAMLKWNIYAIILGNVVFSLSMCILNGRSLRHAARYIQEKKKTFILPAIAALIMGAAAYGVHLLAELFIGGRVATLIALVAAVMVYGISLLKLGGLTEDEMRSLPKGTKILRICKKLHLMKEEY